MLIFKNNFKNSKEELKILKKNLKNTKKI